jgi:hypothetical protein
MSKVYLGISIVLACTTLCFGQMDKRKTAPMAEPGDRVFVMSGTTIDAQLQKSVDVNNAKIGDEVILKVTKSIKQNGEVVIPKGTALIGRVTDVQKRTKGNSTSRLGMVFDRIQGRDLSAPFSASIMSITNIAAQAGVADSLMTDTSGSSQTSGGVSRGSSGGGLLGGVGNTVGGLVSTTSQTVGTVTNTAAQTAGATTGTVGRSLNGIQISSSASGSANGTSTLSSTNKNLRVEKGATFNLRVNGQVARQE